MSKRTVTFTVIDCKQIYHESLKEFFRILFIKTRHEHGLTQEQMAESLHIAVRNYQNIESGKTLCETDTLITFWFVYLKGTRDLYFEIKEFLEKKKSQYMQNV